LGDHKQIEEELHMIMLFVQGCHEFSLSRFMKLVPS